METPLFLFHIFDKVRQEQRIGISEYLLLVELLQRYPITSYDALVFACETIWLKHTTSRQAFRELFAAEKSQIESFLSAMQTIKAPVSVPELPLPDKDFPIQKSFVPEPEVIEKTESEAAPPPVEKEIPQGTLRFSLSTATGGVSVPAEQDTVKSSSFLFGNEYFPIANRHLQQSWRYLKSRQQGSPLPEIDILRTIRQTTKDAVFSGFIFKKMHVNLLSLYILLDHEGSMTTFEEFGKELIHSAKQSDLHANMEDYYFYNTPHFKRSYNMTNKDGSSCSSDKIFSNTNRKHKVVLIYSDAGAGRGGFNTKRIDATKQFLHYLNKRVGNIAWLNPIPRHRWAGTTAEGISELVPMYDTTRSGFDGVMNALKGKAQFRK